MRRLTALVVVMLASAAPASAQVIYGPLRPMANTLVHTDAGGNLGITGDVNCTSGCSGGTTDTDDGTVAGGQSTGIAINLSHLWNGVSWVRMPGDATSGLKVQLPEVTGTETVTTIHSQSLQIGGTTTPGNEWHAAQVTSVAPLDAAQALVVRNRSGMASVITGPATSNDGLAHVLVMRDATGSTSMEPQIRTDAVLIGDRGIMVRPIPSATLPQLVSAASLPLPTGAATEATQASALLDATTATLGISGVYTSVALDVAAYAKVTIVSFSDQASAISGLRMWWSNDGANFADVSDFYSTSAGFGKSVVANVKGRWLKVIYTNGVLAQTVFRMHTVGHRTGMGTTDGITVLATNATAPNLKTEVSQGNFNLLLGTMRIDQTTPGTTNRVDVGVFPDNEPFNVAQINGVTPLMGVGASGAGAQRVAALIQDGADIANVTSDGSLQAEPPRTNYVAFSGQESVAAGIADTWYIRRQWALPASAHFTPSAAWATVTTALTKTLVGVANSLGTLNVGTNTFAAVNSVASPFFYGRLFGCVTTVLSATLDTVTPTYTDELGNSQATAGVAFAASLPVGNCMEFPLAAGTPASTLDAGVRAVTAAVDTAATTGVITFYGVNALADFAGTAANQTESLSLPQIPELNSNEQIVILMRQAAVTAQLKTFGVGGSLR